MNQHKTRRRVRGLMGYKYIDIYIYIFFHILFLCCVLYSVFFYPPSLFTDGVVEKKKKKKKKKKGEKKGILKYAQSNKEMPSY